MKKARLLMILVLIFITYTQTVNALNGNNIDDLLSMTLEDLMNMKISVASKSNETPRETPGIISVVTSEDIRNNHCRDMVDVLNMVPGFNITKDDDYIGISSRGLYGFEGRTLIMIDGMQLSDLFFGSYLLGNDFPIHLVKRIEIIRGPGSVLYGGTAELAVINIVSEDGELLKGGQAMVRIGTLPSKIGHSDVGFTVGNKIDNFDFSALGFVGNSIRSDDLASYIGKNSSFKHNWQSAGNESANVILKAKYNNNTQVNFGYNRYKHYQVRSFKLNPIGDPDNNVFTTANEGIAARKVAYTFDNITAAVTHSFAITDRVKIIPSFNYQNSMPYQRVPVREDVTIQRFKPSVYLAYNAYDFEITAGGEYFADYCKVIRPTPADTSEFLRKKFADIGVNNLLISNYAAYSNIKYLWNLDLFTVNMNAGIRFDQNELFGNKINPRFGITILNNKWHAKLLYSTAFRAPLVANNAFSRYGLNPDPALNTRSKTGVKPENTEVYEFETGYQITKNLLVSTNVFFQKVNNIIEFRYNFKNEDVYSDNGGNIATWGVEGEIRYVSPKFKSQHSFSFVKPKFYGNANPWAYTSSPKGGDTYISPDVDKNGSPTNLTLLGVPTFKYYGSVSYEISNGVFASINGLYLSEKNAYMGNGATKLIPQQFITSFGIECIDVVDNLDAIITIHDCFNQQQKLVTAWYDGSYDVLNYKGREISLALRYRF